MNKILKELPELKLSALQSAHYIPKRWIQKPLRQVHAKNSSLVVYRHKFLDEKTSTVFVVYTN